jgi:hypothetical protein
VQKNIEEWRKSQGNSKTNSKSDGNNASTPKTKAKSRAKKWEGHALFHLIFIFIFIHSFYQNDFTFFLTSSSLDSRVVCVCVCVCVCLSSFYISHRTRIFNFIYIYDSSQRLMDVIFVSNFLIEFEVNVSEIVVGCWVVFVRGGYLGVHLSAPFCIPFQSTSNRFVAWKQPCQEF